MATTIIIKNSSVEGKVPDASSLQAAELAVNLADQKLYSKDTDGNVFELTSGSVSSGGSGDRPTNPEIGDIFWDTDLEILLIWNGSEWVPIGGDRGDLELSAELGFSAANNAEVQWGTTVRAIPTVIGGVQPVRLTYQWRNSFGVIVSDTEIPGATAATYEIPEAKLGFSIYCRVTATDAVGTEVEADTNTCLVIEKVAEGLWTEDSGALYPTTRTNDVLAGERDPGEADARGVRLAVDSSNGGCYVQAKGSSTASVLMAFQALHGTEEKFKVSYDGNGTFAGGVNGRYFYAVTPDGEWNSFINQGAATNKNTVINNGSADVITFNNDGSASFDGQVSIGTVTNNSALITINDDAVNPTIYSRNNNGSGPVFGGFGSGSNTVPTSTIGSDGSATFAGDVQAGGNAEDASRPVGSVVRSAGSLTVARASGNVFAGYTAGTNSETSTIGADGSATFGRQVISNRYSQDSGLSVNYNGTDYGYALYDQTKLYAGIGLDGSASFAGKLQTQDTTIELAFSYTIIKTDAVGFWSPDNWSFGPDVSDPSSAVITLNATDGSALFAGRLESKSIIKTTSNSGFQSVSVDGGAQNAFRAVDNSGNTNITLNADGTASFAGSHNGNPKLRIGDKGQLFINSSSTTPGDTIIGVSTDGIGSTASKFSVLADGSTSFANYDLERLDPLPA